MSPIFFFCVYKHSEQHARRDITIAARFSFSPRALSFFFYFCPLPATRRAHQGIGVDWSHYKHLLPEHVYNVYMKSWGDVRSEDS